MSKIDVYGFIDADTEEAHAFTTYLRYWDCLGRAITETYGSDHRVEILDDLEDRRSFRRLRTRPFAGDKKVLRELLLNGWNSEQNLYLVDEDDPRISAQTQWINVYAYYSSGRAALAWILAQKGSAPTTHRSLLKALAEQTGSSFIPAPWDLTCTSTSPLAYSGFKTAPVSVSNLESNAPCHGCQDAQNHPSQTDRRSSRIREKQGWPQEGEARRARRH